LVFYSIRSERVLIEQLDYNLLFRWFVGLAIAGQVWNHAVFSKNRDRLLNQEISRSFFARIKLRPHQAASRRLMSDDPFTIGGTLIEAWPVTSFRRKDSGDDSGAGGDFDGEKRTNQTHESRLIRMRGFAGNRKARKPGSCRWAQRDRERHGLIAEAMTTHAEGTAEADAALLMLQDLATAPAESRCARTKPTMSPHW